MKIHRPSEDYCPLYSVFFWLVFYHEDVYDENNSDGNHTWIYSNQKDSISKCWKYFLEER